MDRPITNRVWAQTGARKDPGTAKYQVGWGPEIPTYEVLNFLQYRIDLSLFALAERGAPEWGGDIAYYKGALAWDNSTSKVYIAKVANPNRTLAPSKNPGQWDVSSIQISEQAFVEAGQKFDNHIARTDNPHRVDAGQAGTYTAEVIDQKVAASNKSIDDHVKRKDNPHGTTAALIGAVPEIGGVYSGPVTFQAMETKINPGAGDYAIRAAAGGTDFFGLRMGSMYLGLRPSSGRVLLRNASGDDWLMGESEYINARKSIEPDYAAPTPDCEIDALSDIHLRQGFGFTELVRPQENNYVAKDGTTKTAAAGMPRHTKLGLALDQMHQEYLSVDATLNGGRFEKVTMFWEFIWNSDKQVFLYSDDSGKNDYVYITVSGQVWVRFIDNDGAQRNFHAGNTVNGQVSRLAYTFDGVTVRTFLNGVEGKGGDISYTRTAPSKIFIGHTGRTADSRVFFLRRFRTWASLLTDKQISTL